MPLTAGTRLGPHEIIAPLGAGGMGEVYRARDTRLGRDVAVKVLPQHLSTSPDLRARFEREARTISSLNHPHICVLHDVGREGETDYLVMELVEGETLADRIEKGVLPLDQVLRLGGEIADALERAHRAGIVHRDLKPGNVMLTKSGAKLMDFGLARGGAPGSAPSNLSQSPTMTRPLTQEGHIVGTFQYMAPEQLEGGEADARSDLWALGCVLYEMATGKKAFEGKSQASLIGAIMHAQPAPMSGLAPMSPPALERAVKQCLAKDPDERWQSAGDLRRELLWIAQAGSASSPVPGAFPAAPPRRKAAWVLPALAMLAVTLAGVSLFLLLRRGADREEPVRFAVSSPAGAAMATGAGSVAVSPDGAAVVFVGADSSGQSGLWVRRLADMTPRFLAGTTDASYPFWSPDSRQIAFFAQGKLKRISTTGGEVTGLCDAPDGRGGSWGSRGVIVFAPSATSGLLRVGAEGGSTRAATPVDSARGEISHRYPWFLPDGRRFLYMAQLDSEGTSKGQAFAGSLDSPRSTPILATDRAPVYAAAGYLLFAQGGGLVAQRFNLSKLRLEGDPVRLSENVPESVNSNDRVASVSNTGVLVMPTPLAQNTQLAWLNRQGEVLGRVPLPPGVFGGAVLSPDGTRVAMSSGTGDDIAAVWVFDLARASATRLTFGASMDRSPLWSPDGSSLVFQSNRRHRWDLYLKRASGAGADSLLYASSVGWKTPTSWSRDGDYIAFDTIGKGTGFDIWVLSARGDRKAVPYLKSRADERYAQISPDGHWLVYVSNESGRFEVYAQSFPTPGAKYQATTTGALAAGWSRDGHELFILTPDGALVSLPVIAHEDGLQFGAPAKLFKTATLNGLDVTADGRRFLTILPVNAAEAPSLTVVLNWASGIRGQARR